MSASAWSRCEYYRHVCLLPTVVDSAFGSIWMPAGLVWAVVVESELGRIIKQDLECEGRRCGPVIAHPRTATWSFLIRSDIPAPALAQLRDRCGQRVRVMTAGEPIALPSPDGYGTEYRCWIVAAHTPVRASGVPIVESIRAHLGHAGSLNVAGSSDTAEASVVEQH